MPDPSTHDDLVSVSITLGSTNTGKASFSTVLILADKALGNTLNGARVMEFANILEVEDAETAGYISSTVSDMMTDMFNQTNKPEKIKVGKVDTAAAETYATGLAAVIAADDDFYGIVLDVRTDAKILLVAAAVETYAASGIYKLFGWQTNDTGFIASGFPAAFSAMDEYERSVAFYHDSDGEFLDACVMANRLSFDADAFSAPWNAPVQEVAALTTKLTQTQKAYARTNAGNVALAFGTRTDTFVDPGHNCNNRPVYEIVTTDWFRARVQERIADLISELGDRGEKLPVSIEGQALVMKEIDSVFLTGVSAGHFASGQTIVEAETISDADRTAQRMRFSGRAQFAIGARQVEFDFYFSTDPVFVAV